MKRFEWSAGDSHPLFPIDYTEHKFSEEYRHIFGRGKNGRYAVQRLTNQQWFKDYCAASFTKEGDQEKTQKSLPIEAVPFFIQFIKTVQGESRRGDVKYSGYFPGEDGKKDCTMDDKVCESFLNDLFLAMHEEVQTGVFHDGLAQEDHSFYANVLYNNVDFSGRITEHLWDTMIKDRLKILASLAQEVSPATQMDVLLGCIRTLDWGISILQNAPREKRKRNRSVDEVLAQLINELTSERTTVETTNQYVTYSIDNIPVQLSDRREDTLEGCFQRLRKAKDEGELRDCRKAYLGNIARKCEQSQFLYKYMELKKYTDSILEPLDHDTVLLEVKKYMLQRSRYAIRWISTYEQDRYFPQADVSFRGLGYCCSVLEPRIEDSMRGIDAKIDSLIDVIYRLELELGMIGLNLSEADSPGKVIWKEITQEGLKKFFPLFSNLWHTVYHNQAAIAQLLPCNTQGYVLSASQIARIAQILEKDYCHVAPMFDGAVVPHDAENIRLALEQYSRAVANPQNDNITVSLSCTLLLKIMLVLFLDKYIEDAAPDITDTFFRLQECYI